MCDPYISIPQMCDNEIDLHRVMYGCMSLGEKVLFKKVLSLWEFSLRKLIEIIDSVAEFIRLSDFNLLDTL